MKNLTLAKAQELKLQGITHIASVVKSTFDTTYYHVNSIASLQANNGKWIPAPIYNNGWHGRFGITSKNVDWNTTKLTNVL